MSDTGWIQGWVRSYNGSGLGPTAALRDFRRAGGSVGDAHWFRAWGQERANLAAEANVMDVPLNRRPTPDERGVWFTRQATGVVYRVQHTMIDPVTGAQTTIFTNVKADEYLSYGRVLRQAMAAVEQDDDDRYPLEHSHSGIHGVYDLEPQDWGDGA